METQIKSLEERMTCVINAVGLSNEDLLKKSFHTSSKEHKIENTETETSLHFYNHAPLVLSIIDGNSLNTKSIDSTHRNFIFDLNTSKVPKPLTDHKLKLYLHDIALSSAIRSIHRIPKFKETD